MTIHPTAVIESGAELSSSVRVGPSVGAMTLPVATSRFAIKHVVPLRMYSNSRRSSRPGRIGRVGAARSSAWMLVFSSVETTWVPCACSAGAC